MDQIFPYDETPLIIPYLDDIIIFSKDEDGHIEHLKITFKKLEENKIWLNRKKCKFIMEEIRILGHIIRRGEVQVDNSKIETIKK